MLRVWLILTAAAACGLIAASCAETGTALATAAAAQAATQAATLASTQAIATAQAATTQLSNTQTTGTTIIETPDYYIIFQNGQRIIISKSYLHGYTGLDQQK